MGLIADPIVTDSIVITVDLIAVTAIVTNIITTVINN